MLTHNEGNSTPNVCANCKFFGDYQPFLSKEEIHKCNFETWRAVKPTSTPCPHFAHTIIAEKRRDNIIYLLRLVIMLQR